MYLETGEYDKCIADCDSAVEKGRELRADYKVIARALTRKANALAKQERYEEAVQAYHKSLTEHRHGQVLVQSFMKLSAQSGASPGQGENSHHSESKSCILPPVCDSSSLHEQQEPPAGLLGAFCVLERESCSGCECVRRAVLWRTHLEALRCCAGTQTH